MNLFFSNTEKNPFRKRKKGVFSSEESEWIEMGIGIYRFYRLNLNKIINTKTKILNHKS